MAVFQHQTDKDECEVLFFSLKTDYFKWWFPRIKNKNNILLIVTQIESYSCEPDIPLFKYEGSLKI